MKNDKSKNFVAKKDETIVEGDVLVTKNPCSHPGDI